MDPKLYKAATMGDVEQLKEDAAVNTQLLYSEAPHQQTALHIAARLGHEEFVRRMMKLCRPLVTRQNSDEDTPLHCAARNGSVEVIKAMVDRAPSVDVERGDVMVLMRMRNGRGNTALHEALRWGHGAAAVKLLQGDPALSFAINNAGESALHLAAKSHLPRVIEEIFSLLSTEERKQVVRQEDNSGRTALHYAAGRDKDDIVEKLLRNDLSVAYIQDHDGYSPLHIAAASGCSRAISALLNRCPDALEQRDPRGRNALHISIINFRRLEERLLQHTIINEPDKAGNTPLHLAAKLVRTRVVMGLLRKKCVDQNAKNKDGLTALDLAKSQRKSLPARAMMLSFVLKIYGGTVGRPRQTPMAIDEILPSDRDFMGNKIDTEMAKEVTAIYTVAVALVATVTFAAAFTMPGGYKGDGTPTLVRSATFKAFMLSNTISLCTSLTAGVCFMMETSTRVYGRIWNVDVWGFQLAIISFSTLLISFMMAIFAMVSSECMWLAIAVCLICCAPFVLNLSLFTCEITDMTPHLFFVGRLLRRILHANKSSGRKLRA